jgi:hypothetical protein
MNVRMLLAGVLGGVILFVWGFLAWVILPVHKTAIHEIPKQDTLIAALQSALSQKGVYAFPSMPQNEPSAADEHQWEERYRKGPIGMIVYDPAGSAPMMPVQMAIGIVINIISAFFVAWFLARSTALNAHYIKRVAYCGMYGIFLVAASTLVMWNWFNEPGDWVTSLIVDYVVGWVLAGIGIAAIMKSLPPAAR